MDYKIYEIQLEMSRPISKETVEQKFDLNYDIIQIKVDDFIVPTTMDRETLQVNCEKLPYYKGVAIINVESDDKGSFSASVWGQIMKLVRQIQIDGNTVEGFQAINDEPGLRVSVE